MATYGITDKGFTLKRLYNIISDIDAKLALVQDPTTGETLNLDDENDPIIQLRDAVADQLSECWEQLQMCYNAGDPLKATGAAQSGLVLLNGLVRNLSESDTALRLRQQNRTALTSYSHTESIYSAVAQVPGVTFCRVYQNSTLTNPDGRGIPAKSVAVVVVGGDDQAIADAIFSKMHATSGIYGTTSKTCYDSLGVPYTIKFSRPSVVPINIVANLTVIDTSEWPTDGEDQVKAALVAYAQYGLESNIGLPPGVDIINSRLYSPINSVPGHEIDSILLSRDALVPTEQNVAIGWNEVAEVTVDRITVNI